MDGIKRLLSLSNRFVELVRSAAPKYPQHEMRTPKNRWGDQSDEFRKHPKEHHIERTMGPKGEEFLNKEPPHLFENPFQEQVDLDVDQISPEDIHPNDPTGPQFYDESVWYNPDEEESDLHTEQDIIIDPNRRQKRLREKQRLIPPDFK